MGKLLCADECIAKKSRISFTRALIEVNVPRTLPGEVTVMDPNRGQFQQKV